MTFPQIWLNSYFHPRRAMDALAEKTTPRYGALYALIRGLMLSLLFSLPFYLLKFQPISPAYLKIFDTPNYFLIETFLWPIYMLLTWVYLSSVGYVILRLLGYRANFDQMLNLEGLLYLTIGVVLLLFDWLLVLVNFHSNPQFIGIAHTLIADPWAIALTAIFYKKYFGVPVGLSILLGIVTRILYMPIAIVFLRT